VEIEAAYGGPHCRPILGTVKLLSKVYTNC
jgi:hypothetical protein